MTIHQLTLLRSLRDRREQRARKIVEEFRRAEIEPRRELHARQGELNTHRAARNHASEELFLAQKAQTSVEDQVGARAGLARIDSSVQAASASVSLAENALAVVVKRDCALHVTSPRSATEG